MIYKKLFGKALENPEGNTQNRSAEISGVVFYASKDQEGAEYPVEVLPFDRLRIEIKD